MPFARKQDPNTGIDEYTFSPTSGTSITGTDDAGNSLSYLAGAVHVWLNGVKMNGLTATDGTTISGFPTLVSGDKVAVMAINPMNIADAYTKSAADAKYALLGANSDITSLSGLTTPLSEAQGGTGATSAPTASGGYTSVQVFTADGTWTKPAGINLVVVEVVGGGGGGGYGITAWPSTGGGAGGTAIKTIDVSAISSETVTVGLGGSGGDSSASKEPGVDQAAESSSFGAHCSATPGEDQTATQGLDGGAGSGGDINIRGGHGRAGYQIDSSHSYDIGGSGGDSTRGGGGYGGNQENGQAGLHGSGGGGCESSTTYDGGDGGDGIVIVWEYT